jgi:hypothetical protein
VDQELSIWSNDTDFVIAESVRDAAAICSELTGHASVEAYLKEYPESDWHAWPKDKVFPFREDLETPMTVTEVVVRTLGPGEVVSSGKPVRGIPPTPRSKDLRVVFHAEPNGMIYTKTTYKLPSEWIKEHGRGYFACTEV